ncbi:N-acyl-D-amino-acid deacylase family protein [Rhodohalobacter barkolensis]|uniref:Amidohydrolase n=1 Tax=Rhodohalobacter barkolensis TaxID=2053187 RepID=A0A2N0VH28_9BACT|nr:D-aminoacylase [Rhodohalobacter barkolensis]PKD43490.1 amidohydrolase [Rhodohalobacter barkolensis]
MKQFTLLVFLISWFTQPIGVKTQSTPHNYDILIKNGKVLDGTGNPWYYADIGINDDRIVWVGKSDNVTADEVIDATGLYVSPGFIDVHSHAGSGLASESLSHGRPLLAQGITTVMVNPDGGGSTDIAGQRSSLEEHGLGVNVAQFVPHGSVRRRVMGEEDRAPTPDELEEMKSIVGEGMQNGAFGLSSGLFYTPGAYAETEEVIELAKVASRYNGVYSSHIRDESDYNVGLIYSVDEVIQVAEEAELPGIVSHIKALGTGVWGYSAAVVSRVERARDRGVEVFADQYPYPASSTNLTAVLIPAWAREGGRTEMLQRLDDPELIDEIKVEMEANLVRRGGAESIQIADYSADRSLEGLRLNVIADQMDTNAIDAALNMIKEQNPKIVSFNMHEDDVARFMKQPWMMTSSDGGLVEMGDGVVHPRNYGSFPRKISMYVKEKRAIDLEYAVRSMTSLSASVFNLHDRGVIRSGQVADIAIFDLEQIQDKATFDDPHQLSEGVEYVLIGGKFAMKAGEYQQELVGKVLFNKFD